MLKSEGVFHEQAACRVGLPMQKEQICQLYTQAVHPSQHCEDNKLVYEHVKLLE